MGRNLLKLGAEKLHSRMECNASETVVYERPGVGFVEVLAVIGRTEYEVETGGGFMDRMIRNDYIIRRSLLVINGFQIVPERNDVIYQTLDDGTVYKGWVLGEDDIPHYAEADGFGVAYRVHTKRGE